MIFKSHDIPRRKPNFSFNDVPLHWVPDDVLTTHIFNSIHLLAPELEYWFCRLINQVLPLVDDDGLRSDLKGFIAQEASHADAHKYAKIYMDSHEIDVSRIHSRQNFIFRRLLSDEPLGIILPGKWSKRTWLTVRLAGIAAVEHYFCYIGTWALQNNELDAANLHPEMLALLKWHAAEEVEHRTVGFDAYSVMMGNGRISAYFLRQSIMLLVLPAVAALLMITTLHIAKQDGSTAGRILSKRGFLMALDYYKISTRTGRLPSLGIIGKGLLAWMKPFHHPEHEGDERLAKAYLKSMQSL